MSKLLDRLRLTSPATVSQISAAKFPGRPRMARLIWRTPETGNGGGLGRTRSGGDERPILSPWSKIWIMMMHDRTGWCTLFSLGGWRGPQELEDIQALQVETDCKHVVVDKHVVRTTSLQSPESKHSAHGVITSFHPLKAFIPTYTEGSWRLPAGWLSGEVMRDDARARRS
jgi:hypothetical protein